MSRATGEILLDSFYFMLLAMQIDKILSKSASYREETKLQDSQCGPAEANPEQSQSVIEQSTKYQHCRTPSGQ